MSEEVTVNARGGVAAKIPYRCDLLPPRAVLAVAQTLGDNVAKRGKDNWRKIDRSQHINHAISHLFLLLAGDNSESHLEHAACRLLFALETDDGSQED